MKFQEFKQHFPEKISQSLERYVTNTVLKDSRYLFIKTVAGAQFAYCTHCNKQHHSTKKLKHKQKERAVCPHCNSRCHVQAAGISRKYMTDQAVFVWYEKSKCNAEAVTARIISVYRDYSGDFKNVKTMYNCSHMYLFMPGKSFYYQLSYQGWTLRKSVFSAFDRYFGGTSNYRKFRSLENIRRAVKGTNLQFSTWEKYIRYKNPNYVSDMVVFFDMASRYPCIEYLTKSGFSSLVWPKLYNDSLLGAINWRGKTLEKVLRLAKSEIQELRRLQLDIKPTHLKFYQKLKREGIKMPLDIAYVMAEIDNGFYQSYYVKEILKYTTYERMLQYLSKQLRNNHFKSAKSALSDWLDYIKECRELGKNLKRDSVLFPNNLKSAHRETMKRIKAKENPALEAKIKLRLPELEQYRFEYQDLFLRPASSLFEIFDEGKQLIHCINSYTTDYAEGYTNIFFIRRKEEPDEPYYTMEFKSDRVVQCRGYDNCDMPLEIKKFVDRFMQHVKSLKKRRRTTAKVRIKEAVS